MTIIADLTVLKIAVADLQAKVDTLTTPPVDLTPVLDALAAIDAKIGTETA